MVLTEGSSSVYALLSTLSNYFFSSDAELVITQLIQAFGGGWASITAQVGAQASVSHKHVAMVTAVVLLITELGGAIGSAIGTRVFRFFQRYRTNVSTGGAIWGHLMPRYIAKYLPNESEEIRARLFGSTIQIISLDPSNPVRIGVLRAYSDTMRILIIVALAIGT